MGYHWRRNLFTFSLLLLCVMQFTAAENDVTPAISEEEDDSSSEETVEDSNESRRKRSLESIGVENASKEGEDGKTTTRAAIPGLPDPATILKIAEILQTVGEKVIPILVEGNSAANLVTERFNRDFMFLRSFKKDIEMFMGELKMN